MMIVELNIAKLHAFIIETYQHDIATHGCCDAYASCWCGCHKDPNYFASVDCEIIAVQYGNSDPKYNPLTVGLVNVRYQDQFQSLIGVNSDGTLEVWQD